jgi:hypothetical protein
MGEPGKADECMAKLHKLPPAQVNWQGAWWDVYIARIKNWFHGSNR